MEQAQSIKHFFFGFAQYYVSDGNGDDVLLKVNYKDNNYTIETSGTRCNQRFRQELGEFARSMLRRKHNTNFAMRPKKV